MNLRSIALLALLFTLCGGTVFAQGAPSDIGTHTASTFSAPSEATIAIVGAPITIKWNVKEGVSGNITLAFSDGSRTMFTPVVVPYAAGKATLTVSGCTATATSDSLDCRTMRSRITSGNKFRIQGTYAAGGSILTIHSPAFKAAWPSGAGASCYVNGTYVPSGTAPTFYSEEKPSKECALVSQVRSCTNGVISGSVAYKYASCTAPAPTPDDKTPIGALDAIRGGSARGWTLDLDTPTVSNSVHFYLDGTAGEGTYLGATKADTPRPDLSYSGNHGFSFQIPTQYLTDGKTHTIYAYGINTAKGKRNMLLRKSPLTFTGSSTSSTIGDPVGTPPPGTYTTAQSVTLTSTGATSIRYTTNGTTPTCTTGTLYSAPISVPVTTTIKAIGCSGSGASGVATLSYTISARTTSCTVDGVTVKEGETRTFYKTDEVSGRNRCTFEAERRTCTGGVLGGDSTARHAFCTETIMDLNETLKPTNELKAFGIFQDTAFTSGTDRVLTYRKNGTGVDARFVPITSSSYSARRAPFDVLTFTIGNWKGTPSLSSDTTKVTATGNTIGLSVLGTTTGKEALSITNDGTKTTLHARPIEEMIGEFGALFFPSKYDIPALGGGGKSAKTIFLATPRFEEGIRLKDFESIHFKVDATLKNFTNITGCVPGTPPTIRAQNCHDPKIHATDFRVGFGNLQWTDPRCTKRDLADPVCKYYGDFLYITSTLHDERVEYHSGFLQDRPTASWIYRLSMQNLIAGNPAKNPFKVVGKRTVAEGDIKDIFKNAVIEAESKGYLPPRLTVGGRKENDEEYIAHYWFRTTNIGYEATGLSDITYDVHELSLVGKRSGTLQTPSCDLTVTPNVVREGESATLSWKTAGADRLLINGATSPSLSGSKSITPQVASTYKGTVNGPGGFNVCTATLLVKPAVEAWEQAPTSAVAGWSDIATGALTLVLREVEGVLESLKAQVISFMQ